MIVGYPLPVIFILDLRDIPHVSGSMNQIDKYRGVRIPFPGLPVSGAIQSSFLLPFLVTFA
jgi:hypothetical protein